MFIHPTGEVFYLDKDVDPAKKIVFSRTIGELTLWFSDIVGFSLHVEDSEKKALQLTFQVLELIKHEVKQEKGNVVKTMGDGIFAVFANPIDAVFAAKASLVKLNENRHITRIRIGIHRGKVQLVDNDYFGHNVNIASRDSRRDAMFTLCPK